MFSSIALWFKYLGVTRITQKNRLLDAHRQTIHVRSKIDVGTSFGFTLPSKKDS